jgi:predicted aldo/keto reductase-like oxidoreductase
MKTVTLGSTGIVSPKNAFGALPIQRVSEEYACGLLRRAYEAGFRFFDTANAYTDSEKKIGMALSDVRDDIFIATKTGARDVETFWKNLEQSLRMMKTDHIDVYQFHNPASVPRPGDGTGLYEAALEAKAQGKILHIGITNHRPAVAREAVESGLFETLQFPFCYLASEADIELVRLCKEKNVGFIAMKALSGGLLTDAAACYAWLDRFDNVLPIWGVQRESELTQFISFMADPPAMTPEREALVEKDRAELSGSFCRSCGYCMPCPMGIMISNCARMSQLIRRSPSAPFLTPMWRENMEKIEECVGCGQCREKCPYGLDIPELLKQNLADYRRIISGEVTL